MHNLLDGCWDIEKRIADLDKLIQKIYEDRVLGIYAERSAIFNMITSGESKIRKIIAILPDGSTGVPFGTCRELMVQLMPEMYNSVEIMLDYQNEKLITLDEITPEW